MNCSECHIEMKPTGNGYYECDECGLAVYDGTFDNVNHPKHYTEGRKYEPIDVIEDWKLGFNLGNTVKYISRAGRKDDIVQDLEKARFYLDREIQRLKA